MNIPDDAVKAAVEAAHDVFAMWEWSELNRDESRKFFATILEAAAPYLMSAAWLEGRNSQPDKFAANPYWKESVK